MKKAFIVKQQNIKDCGAACLLSVVKYHGGNIPLEKVIQDTCTNIEGTTAFNIIDASFKYGFDSRGIKLDKKHLLKEKLSLPAICHVQENNLNHFVVIYNITPKKITLMDPAVGKRIISFSDFMNIWSGNLIELFPSRSIVFYEKNIKLKTLFVNVLKNEKSLISKIVVASIFITITTIITGYYFKVVIDNFELGKHFLKQTFILFLFITCIKIMFTKLKLYYELYLNKNVDIYLLRDFLYHVLNLPSKVIQSRTTGEIVARINDLNNFKNLFSEIIVSLLLDSLLVICLIPILYLLNKTLFLILLLLLTIYLILGLSFKGVIYKKILKNIKLENKFTSIFIESISMINSIKNISGINEALNYIEDSASSYLKDSYKLLGFNNIQLNLKSFINEMGTYIVNTIGFVLLINNSISISELITFNALMYYFLEPVKNLIDNIPKYNFISASVEKLSEFMNIEKENIGSLEQVNGYGIKLSNLTFSYNKIHNIIKNYNLKINEGEHVLIKGRSGSGKSTICKLLIKHELNYKGEVTFGNINIKDLSLSTIRNNIRYVSQREYLFSETLYQNIVFHKKVAKDYFMDICNCSCVSEIVKTKPMRYQTYINVDSNNFSGGEKQRIILARALIDNFKVLIIDEALSEVDIKTEKRIINNLKTKFKDKTIIYISHKNLDKEFKRVIYV